MTKLVLEIRDNKQVAVLKAILKFFNIAIVEEKTVEDKREKDSRSFYQQFQLDLSDYRFDRQEANER